MKREKKYPGTVIDTELLKLTTEQALDRLAEKHYGNWLRRFWTKAQLGYKNADFSTIPGLITRTLLAIKDKFDPPTSRPPIAFKLDVTARIEKTPEEKAKEEEEYRKRAEECDRERKEFLAQWRGGELLRTPPPVKKNAAEVLADEINKANRDQEIKE